jgi:hypothetical protein
MIGLVALLVIAATACAPPTTEPEVPDAPVELPSDVEAAAKEVVMARSGVPVEEIEVVSAEEEEWPDACLGLAGEDEVCAQVVTPGWEVTLTADGEEYVVRTDQNGSAVRVEE